MLFSYTTMVDTPMHIIGDVFKMFGSSVDMGFFLGSAPSKFVQLFSFVIHFFSYSSYKPNYFNINSVWVGFLGFVLKWWWWYSNFADVSMFCKKLEFLGRNSNQSNSARAVLDYF